MPGPAAALPGLRPTRARVAWFRDPGRLGVSEIERQVKKAQHRLWVNRWLRLWGWCLIFAAGARFDGQAATDEGSPLLHAQQA